MDISLTHPKNEVVGILLAVTLILMSACAGSKQSSQKLAQAGRAMEQIEQVGAMDYSVAEFKEAQYKLEEARRLAEHGKHKRAALKAEEASAVAKLAEVMTLSKKADESLSELKASIQSLKEKLEKYQQK